MTSDLEYVDILRQGDDARVCPKDAETICSRINGQVSIAHAMGHQMPYVEVEQIPVTEGLTFTFKEIKRVRR